MDIPVLFTYKNVDVIIYSILIGWVGNIEIHLGRRCKYPMFCSKLESFATVNIKTVSLNPLTFLKLEKPIETRIWCIKIKETSMLNFGIE